MTHGSDLETSLPFDWGQVLLSPGDRVEIYPGGPAMVVWGRPVARAVACWWLEDDQAVGAWFAQAVLKPVLSA